MSKDVKNPVTEESTPKEFQHKKLQDGLLRDRPQFDINMMYERVVEELGLQQSKRDQLITIYLAAFAFIVPPLLSAEIPLDPVLVGGIFTLLGVIGYLFALVIIRYRKYKEIYWLCCRTLNVMMDVDPENWHKSAVQGIFYNCMCKKVSKYADPVNKTFATKQFVKDNFFSSETLYLIIHALITAGITGFGVGMILPLCDPLKYTLGALVALVVMVLILCKYFETLVKLYQVCVDGLDESFNSVFKDAWFLHFFLSRETVNNENKGANA